MTIKLTHYPLVSFDQSLDKGPVAQLVHLNLNPAWWSEIGKLAEGQVGHLTGRNPSRRGE